MELLYEEKPFSSFASSLEAPSDEQWEMIREFVVRYWYNGDKTVRSLTDHLRIVHEFKVTEKTLKSRINRWGLRKNLTHEDARDLLNAFDHLKTLSKPDIVLIRGKVETLEHVQRYLRRGGKGSTDEAQNDTYDNGRHASKVIIISQHPILRPQPALIILRKLEGVLRELQRLVITAKDNDLSVSDDDQIHWITSSIETSEMEQDFQTSIWEGARAFEEGNTAWAGLCWRSASLRLENLLWEPDINIWMSYIRCCIRLHRFGLEDVGKHLHQKLRSFREFLPILAPHRALVYALTDASFDDFINGGLFLLDAHLRQLELMWPDLPNAHVLQKLHLVEERLYQNYLDDEVEPYIHHKTYIPANKDELREYINTQIHQISKSTLTSDHRRAESLTKSCISELEKYSGLPNIDLSVPEMISQMYNILGNILYHQQCYEKAWESYVISIEMDCDFANHHNEHALGPYRLHRTFTILSWLAHSTSTVQTTDIPDFAIYQKDLEKKVETQVKQAEIRRVGLRPRKQAPCWPKQEPPAKSKPRVRPLRSPHVALDRDKVHTRRQRRNEVRKSQVSAAHNIRPTPPRPTTPWA